MKTKVVIIVLWILMIGLIGTIFFLSSQNGEETARTSSHIAQTVAKFIYTDPTPTQINGVHMYIRKLAHITLFFSLGILLFVTLVVSFSKTLGVKNWILLIISAILISSCGFFDEWHKQFISGRHFDFGESLLNIGFGITGILITFIIVSLSNKFRRRKKPTHIMSHN